MINYENQEDIELSELFTAAWNSKLIISLITSIFAIVSIFYALSLPNIYSSYAMLKPSDNSNSSSNILGQYAGMASLAGISIGSSGSTDKSIEAIERIRSYEFFSKFFLPEIAYQDLVAVKDWNSSNNILIYDDEVFDTSAMKWVDGIPSTQDAFKTYNDIVSLYQDKKTRFVSLSIKHHSPHIAKKWVDILIKKINSSMRNEEKAAALKSVDFLNEQMQQVNYQEIRQAIASLQENQLKSLMLIESNEDYIFKILDPAIVPEKKSEPKRSLIVIIATILGFFISLIFALGSHFLSNKNNKL